MENNGQVASVSVAINSFQSKDGWNTVEYIRRPF